MTCALGAAASSAAADDGRITFTGSIASTTCVVTGGGPTVTGAANGNFTVGLPRVSVTSLNAAGERAGDTPFYIRLSGASCTNGAVARVYFEPAQSTNINAATGNLKNATGTGRATRVEVGLLNSNRAAINMFNDTPQTTRTIASNAAQFDYWAQYVATGGAATAGTVSTDVVYSIIYN
ncbi:fimbrial protein [Cupriavidus agavae]|nr:fimbrial protein [Cupriavidus agavae]